MDLNFRTWLDKRESSAFTRSRTQFTLGLGPAMPDAALHSRSTCPPGELENLKKKKSKKASKKKKSKKKVKSESVHSYYKCPQCKENTAINGILGKELWFRGSAQCFECNYVFSAMNMKPLFKKSIIEEAGSDIDKWLSAVDDLKRDLDGLEDQKDDDENLDDEKDLDNLEDEEDDEDDDLDDEKDFVVDDDDDLDDEKEFTKDFEDKIFGKTKPHKLPPNYDDTDLKDKLNTAFNKNNKLEA